MNNKSNVEDVVSRIRQVNTSISELEKLRTQLIKDNEQLLLTPVCNMMDWKLEDFDKFSVEYSSFEKRIMIEIYLKTDKNARCVFELNGQSKLALRFRQDFSKPLDPFPVCG